MLFSPSGGTPDIISLIRWGQKIGLAVREAIAKEK
jgi:hypothetical protein